MILHLKNLKRPAGIGGVALAASVFALASYGAVSAGIGIYATVHCGASAACQQYINSKGSGAFGKSTNAASQDQFHGLGLGGYGSGGNGVYGTSTLRNAGYFDGQNTGYYALFADNNVSGGYLFGAANTADGGFLSVDSLGNLEVSGTLTGNALKVRHPVPGSQDVSSYTAESTGRTLEDVGVGHVVGGRGVVQLDPTFARTIEPNYLVFVTPLGRSHGLYVSTQNRGTFEVRESEGAASLAFNYRIVGTPLGSSHLHLPLIQRIQRSRIPGHAP